MSNTTKQIELSKNLSEVINAIGKQPRFILQSITPEEILASPEADYNRSEAKRKLNLFNGSNPRFFYNTEILKYSNSDQEFKRFYILYELDGFKMFTNFDLFMSCLHNGGFAEANIIDFGDQIAVYTQSFFENGNYAENNAKNRKVFAAKKLTVTDL